MRILISILLIFSLAPAGLAQYNEVKLADEYFQKGEYLKAVDGYESCWRKKITLDHYYENYRASVLKLDDAKSAEKFFKKILKKEPSNLIYRIDHALYLRFTGNDKAFQKSINSVHSDAKNNALKVNIAAGHFVKREEFKLLVDLYVKARSASPDKYAYSRELAGAYAHLGNKSKMIQELLNHIRQDPNSIQFVQQSLQQSLKKEDYPDFEKIVYDRIRQHPSEIVFNRLLVWYYTQKRDFYNGYLQAKAVDKRESNRAARGKTLMDLGKIARENYDYDNAILCFSYISENFGKSYYAPTARRLSIEVREEKVKSTYPVKSSEIKSLISDYSNIFNTLRSYNEKAQIQRNVARLYSFYLDRHDTAMTILQRASSIPGAKKDLIAKCKILMGDISLLKEEPWESTLYYSQAEKLVKDTRTAHEAKLKNARLSYFRGDFELSQAHLDVLKLATSREISNDAIDLSLLITDNVGLDTTDEAMKQYASVELLIFQSKFDQALSRLNDLYSKYKEHSLADEILWLRSEIFLKTGKTKEAITQLEKIKTSYAEDIFGDNATFKLAEIYETKLKDYEKAKELYKEVLITYPGSIYSAEARKRFRRLRGDRIN